jgi:hypothetical protein
MLKTVRRIKREMLEKDERHKKDIQELKGVSPTSFYSFACVES